MSEPTRSAPIPPGSPPLSLRSEPFGSLPDGAAATLYTLRHLDGTTIRLTDFGAIVTAIEVADREGDFADVTLGFDTLAPYVGDHPYFGSLVGRYANRIARGRFTLDGRVHELAVNNPPNHLHGGIEGFNRKLWRVEGTIDTDSAVGVVFGYRSPDGEEGYPGTLDARATYTLGSDGTLTLELQATTDRATPVSLAQHAYFNLAGAGIGDILGHRLQLNASAYTPTDETQIPTGEVASVRGTPFDFTRPTPIGERIDDRHPQLERGRGYDHNFVLDRRGEGLTHAARLYHPESGRVLDISTTEPGIQFYSGNLLDGSFAGRGGRLYPRRSAVALETQHFPDSPNQPAFPSTILHPGEEYRSVTVYAFSAV